MNESRVTSIALLTILVVLATANALVYVEARSAARPAAARSDDRWQRWLALTAAERAMFVGQYRALAQRPDGQAIWRRAHELGRLSATEEAHLRELIHLTDEILAQQPPASLRDYVRASAEARAFLIYQALRTQDPDRLATLRAEWLAQP